MPPYRPEAERFWEKVDRQGPSPAHAPELGACWLWTAATAACGSPPYVTLYGKFHLTGGAAVRAHRWAWESENGPIPAGRLALHRCDTPLCVRPAHLFLGSHADNAADKAAKGRSVAHRGEANGRAKLTAAQAAEIRDLYRAGSGTYRSLANRFGVSGRTVAKIVRGEGWVDEPALDPRV